MGINSVQKFVLEQVDGVTTPYADPVVAFEDPPIPTDYSGAPLCYVMNAEMDGHKQTMTPGAYFEDKHSVYLYVGIARAPNAANNNSLMPLICDAMVTACRESTMSGVVIYTDPDTQYPTEILNCGDTSRVRILPQTDLGEDQQSMVLFQAELLIVTIEKVQFGVQGGTQYEYGGKFVDMSAPTKGSVRTVYAPAARRNTRSTGTPVRSAV